jgi:hypothetical protein
MANVDQGQPGLGEQAADGVQGEEPQVADVGEAALAVLPEAAHQAAEHVHILQIRDAGDDMTAGGQDRGGLAQNAPGVDQVFEQVGEDNGVERPGREGEAGRFNVGRYNLVEPAAGDRGCLRHQLDAGDVVATLFQQAPEFAGAATDVEDTATARRHQRGHLGPGLDVIGGGSASGLRRGSRAGRLHPWICLNFR